MKFTTLPAAAATALLLAAPAAVAVSPQGHRHVHRHEHGHFKHPRPSPGEASFFEIAAPKQKRGGQCQFPTDDPNMVAVTPDATNAGWAMSPDQECKPGDYCPFACKPGMVMNQWESGSSYTPGSSMNGGLYCNEDGEIEKPFKGSANCVEGTGSVVAVNKCGKPMSWCQTVLPGNEAMLIPTLVGSSATIAVPDDSYWCSTAAHYYINPPGTGTEGCIWGDDSKPIGNWAPYVAGANADGSGQTFVKLGWNPIWQDSPLKDTPPDFGLEITCSGGGCNGLPCKINPSNGVGKVSSDESAVGAGGSAFCVVTVPKGSTANIVAFSVGSGSSDSDDDDSESDDETTTSPAPPKTTAAKKSTTEAPTTEATSTADETTTSEADETTSSDETSSKTKAYDKITKITKTNSRPRPTLAPGIFAENATTPIYGTPTASRTGSQAAPTTSKEGDAVRQKSSTAFVGFVVAFIAAVCFF